MPHAQTLARPLASGEGRLRARAAAIFRLISAYSSFRCFWQTEFVIDAISSKRGCSFLGILSFISFPEGSFVQIELAESFKIVVKCIQPGINEGAVLERGDKDFQIHCLQLFYYRWDERQPHRLGGAQAVEAVEQ